MRGTSNSNVRGSSRDRAARKRWLLENFEAAVVGPGHSWEAKRTPVAGMCRCYRCGVLLSADTITVDRIRPGCRGGRYVRGNIRPACAKCNSSAGGKLRSRP